MNEFLNNSELTEEIKINLSARLGITHGQVKHFFQLQSKKPRNVSVETYSKLSQGKGLKCVTYTKSMLTCISFVHIASMCYMCVHVKKSMLNLHY